MKKLILVLGLLCAASLSAAPITRLILFKLDLPKGSAEEKVFIDRAMALSKIPGVEAFAWLNIVEAKKPGPYNYGIRILFKDESDIKAYVKHPTHGAFIRDQWKSSVKEMQITDYTESKPDMAP